MPPFPFHHHQEEAKTQYETLLGVKRCLEAAKGELELKVAQAAGAINAGEELRALKCAWCLGRLGGEGALLLRIISSRPALTAAPAPPDPTSNPFAPPPPGKSTRRRPPG